MLESGRKGWDSNPRGERSRLRDFQSRALGQTMRPFQERRAVDCGGEGGIRTRGGFDTSLLFESSTLNHSDTSPPRSIPIRSGLHQTKKPRAFITRGLHMYARQDSNLRPFGPQPNALSPELRAHSGRPEPALYKHGMIANPGEWINDSDGVGSAAGGFPTFWLSNMQLTHFYPASIIRTVSS